jgi:hypothetical protein
MFLVVPVQVFAFKLKEILGTNKMFLSSRD